MRKKFATQYGFVVPEVRLTDDFNIPRKSYQIKVHGTVVAEHQVRVGEVMVLLGNRAAPDIPGEEVREPAFGMRACSVPEMFAEDLKREQVRLRRQHVGAAHASLRSHPQQPAAASFLQGHEGAARAAGPGIPQARRRDLHLAHHLSRPAGGAEAAARRARLDPQPASDHRGDRRDRAACAPHRADRRACAHPHGAADLRRPFRERRAQGAAPRQPLGPRLPPEPEARRQGRGARVRHRSAPARGVRPGSDQGDPHASRRRRALRASSRRPTRGPMCA